MLATGLGASPGLRMVRTTGHAIAIAWAGFWLIAGAALGFGEGGVRQAVAHTLVPGGLFALIAAAVWRWERVGPWAILLCGLAILGHSARQPEVTGVMLLLGGPPFLGGLLLIFYDHLAKARAAHG